MDKICCRTYVVAYLDLLGAKSKMQSDENDRYLNEIYSCLDSCLEKLNELDSIVKGKLHVKVFSDNILIAMKNESPDNMSYPSPFNFIGMYSSLIQRWFLSQNQLLRGAITQGDLFIDNNLIWGKALIQAYEMERDLAHYPRIIIDRALSPLCDDYIDSGQDYQLDVPILTRDFDGELFLDYLNYQKIDFIREQCEVSLLRIYNEIERASDDSVLQKLIWHRNYLQSVLSNE